MTDPQLDRRAQHVLGAIVEEYVATGEPVGSRTLSRRDPSGPSAATIRNTMADLEEKGLLEQPHTSAGRVPTELGYRVYVRALMRERTVPPAEQHLIDRALGQPTGDASDLYAQVPRLLSRLSHQIGVVVTPVVGQLRLRHLEFVRLGARRVVAVIVAETGVIHNKVFETEEDHAQEDLDRAGRYLTDTFQGRTLPEMRERIVALMAEEKALYDRMLRDALTLGSASLDAQSSPAESPHVIVDGTSNLLDAPEFADVERLKGLFRTFEEKHHVLRLLNRCIEEGRPGVQVLIGSETQVPDLSACTVVTSTYGPAGEPFGALGVIGPTRMEYARAVALVDYVSHHFGRLLTGYRS